MISKQYIAVKYIYWATIPSLTIRVYLYSFSCYCLRNMRNVTKFQENLTLQQFKVIDLGVNGKPIYDVEKFNFYPRDAMLARVIGITTCLSAPSGSPKIVVF